MEVETVSARQPDPVVQFSVFTPNRLGLLRELVHLLGAHHIHVLALTVLDTTDSSILRLVLDDPDQARRLLHEKGFPFTESRLVVVEIASPDDLNGIFSALLEAELNINYLYSFIPHLRDKSLLALSMEDNDMAEKVLKRHQFAVLRQSDILR